MTSYELIMLSFPKYINIIFCHLCIETNVCSLITQKSHKKERPYLEKATET